MTIKEDHSKDVPKDIQEVRKAAELRLALLSLTK